jgi:PII-like signaling protein
MALDVLTITCPKCGNAAYRNTLGLYHCKNGHYYKLTDEQPEMPINVIVIEVSEPQRIRSFTLAGR